MRRSRNPHPLLAPVVSRLGDSTPLIPEMHQYCDGWCARCELRSRCRVFRHDRQYRDAVWSREEERERQMDELVARSEKAPLPPPMADEWFAETLGAELVTIQDEGAVERLRVAIARHRRLTETHPLSRAARDYADLAARLARALEDGPLREDARHADALEVIRRLSPAILRKVQRAVRQCLPGHPAEHGRSSSEAARHPQSDANGSAKIARVMVAESLRAWRSLMAPGRAVADGVPAAMTARLDDLDARVAAAFPLAMRFVRPGFDEDCA